MLRRVQFALAAVVALAVGGIAALLSPTHLLLFTGIALILLAPFRAAWSSPEAPSAGLLGVLPALLSITLLTALVAFFFGYVSLFSIDLAFSASAPVRSSQDQRPSSSASSTPGPRTSRSSRSWPPSSPA